MQAAPARNAAVQAARMEKEDGGHVHIYATNDSDGLSMKSPYAEKAVFGEVILNLLPSEDWDEMSD